MRFTNKAKRYAIEEISQLIPSLLNHRIDFQPVQYKFKYEYDLFWKGHSFHSFFIRSTTNSTLGWGKSLKEQKFKSHWFIKC